VGRQSLIDNKDKEIDMTKIKKAKPRKIRNLFAIVAQFRNSAGNMGDKKKEKSKRGCRNSKDWVD